MDPFALAFAASTSNHHSVWFAVTDAAQGSILSLCVGKWTLLDMSAPLHVQQRAHVVEEASDCGLFCVGDEWNLLPSVSLVSATMQGSKGKLSVICDAFENFA